MHHKPEWGCLRDIRCSLIILSGCFWLPLFPSPCSRCVFTAAGKRRRQVSGALSSGRREGWAQSKVASLWYFWSLTRHMCILGMSAHTCTETHAVSDSDGRWRVRPADTRCYCPGLEPSTSHTLELCVCVSFQLFLCLVGKLWAWHNPASSLSSQYYGLPRKVRVFSVLSREAAFKACFKQRKAECSVFTKPI